MPGRTTPARRSVPAASAPASTAARSPRASISSLTASAKPSGSSADSAKSTVIPALPRRITPLRARPSAVNRLDAPPPLGLRSDNSDRGTAAMTWDLLWTNVNLATMTPGGAPYGAIENGALAIEDGRIAWVGPAADLPPRDATEVIDGGGGWLTPGLIDCHT